ncbi:MAG TPA: ribose-phosphate diphosphokinase [Steroidobacteraceae bacterium]|nr:ribose-phosphate diphosphokinase [Steroidobacteraceae bacterium]
MMHSPAPLLAALSDTSELGLAIGRAAKLELVPIEERPFETGEFKLRPLSSVRGRSVFVVQSLAGSTGASVSERLIRLLFLLFGLKDAGAERTIAVIPYLAFARKDRRTQPRDPVTMRYVAQLLEAAAVDRVITLDAHNSAALDNAFRVPVDHLSATPMFVDQVARLLPAAEIAVASPDVGGVKRAQIFRELLERSLGREVEFAFIEKRRAGGAVSSGRVVGEVTDRNVVVLDDLCATGGTLIRAAHALRTAGARTVQVAFTHAPQSAGLAALAGAAAIERIVLTDSVGAALPAELPGSGRMQVLPVAPLLAQAVARIAGGMALAPLLERWPPTDSV